MQEETTFIIIYKLLPQSNYCFDHCYWLYALRCLSQKKSINIASQWKLPRLLFSHENPSIQTYSWHDFWHTVLSYQYYFVHFQQTRVWYIGQLEYISIQQRHKDMLSKIFKRWHWDSPSGLTRFLISVLTKRYKYFMPRRHFNTIGLFYLKPIM